MAEIVSSSLFFSLFFLVSMLTSWRFSCCPPGDLPFPTESWSKPGSEVKTWDDWLSMQGDLSSRLNAVVSGANMKDLWADAGRPRPGDDDLKQSLWRVCSEFFSRPLTVALGLRLFGLSPASRPLTVHLVGAGPGETLGAKLSDYDELNHVFPGHHGIEVVLVGPEVVDGPVLRPPLRAFGPKQRVYVSAYRGLYHHFWEELVEKEEAAKPDLVVGFNPGQNHGVIRTRTIRNLSRSTTCVKLEAPGPNLKKTSS